MPNLVVSFTSVNLLTVSLSFSIAFHVLSALLLIPAEKETTKKGKGRFSIPMIPQLLRLEHLLSLLSGPRVPDLGLAQ